MILNAGMLLRTVEVFDKKSKMDFGNCLLYGYYWDKDLKEESEDIFLDWVSRQAEKISSLLLKIILTNTPNCAVFFADNAS